MLKPLLYRPGQHVIKQVTFALRGHQLINIRTWTLDSQWLVFDVRPSGASFIGGIIERVNVDSSIVETVHHATRGARVGVMTIRPTQERYVFIHGPKQSDAQRQYDFYHRRGVVAFQRAVENLDVMDITAPYTPGTLRGGSYVHVYSPNGQFVSSTYNDYVLHERDPVLDLRNVGVAASYGPVASQGKHPREHSDSHWCVLVSRTTPTPMPGSDETNRAYEEGWVGNHALAFIGDTLAENSDKVSELPIVDLPQDEAGWKQPGGASLVDTATTMPVPSAGVNQRRLTSTYHRHYPGLVNAPRHWVHASPQATAITFLMRDDAGVVQLWLISPQGGEPCQLTYHVSGIQSVLNWHPLGEQLGPVLEDRIARYHAGTGNITFLIKVHVHAPLADAIVLSSDGKQVAWMEGVDGYRQLWAAQTGR